MQDKQSCAELKPAIFKKCTTIAGGEVSDWCSMEGPFHGQRKLSKTESFGGNNQVLKRTRGGV